MKKIFFSLFLTLFCTIVQAENTAIMATLKKLNMKDYEIMASPVPGLKLVAADKNLFYITDDGRYLIHGTMFDLSTPMAGNVTFQYLNQRMEKIKNEMIIYPAKKEKYVITIFTDTTCGYCQKLHHELQTYNDLGITVRYLAFPRDGMDGQTAKNMQSIWCMADRKKAFDAAINGESISPASCNNVNIKKQFELGAQFGIQGTPAIILSNGIVIPGYQSAKDTLAILQKIKPATEKTGTAEPGR